MTAVERTLLPDPEQIRELELIRREYESRMKRTGDPQERLRLYAVKKQIEICIEDMKKRHGQFHAPPQPTRL